MAIEPFAADDAPGVIPDGAPAAGGWLEPAVAGAIAALGVLGAVLLLA